MKNRTRVEFFCREQRKAFGQIKPHLVPEQTERPRSCPVGFFRAFVEYTGEEV